ncbi:MAG TPA: CBS domain-containing protein, partial [Flavisolibacter sp.]|nr:CBS domain-containing protein [Flavisolibacter sp.]
ALFFAHKEEAYLQLKSLVQGLHVSDILMYDYNSLDGGLTAHGAAAILQQNHSKNFIVMDQGRPVGIINRMTIIKAIAEKHYDTRLTKLMSKDLQTLEANALVDSLLDRLSSSEEKIYPVLDNNRFVGVTNFQHIIEYLLLHTSTTNKFAKTKSLAELV